ncbi:unnamed protein product [Discosporangium mesarthrocarpum]
MVRRLNKRFSLHGIRHYGVLGATIWFFIVGGLICDLYAVIQVEVFWLTLYRIASAVESAFPEDLTVYFSEGRLTSNVPSGKVRTFRLYELPLDVQTEGGFLSQAFTALEMLLGSNAHVAVTDSVAKTFSVDLLPELPFLVLEKDRLQIHITEGKLRKSDSYRPPFLEKVETLWPELELEKGLPMVHKTILYSKLRRTDIWDRMEGVFAHFCVADGTLLAHSKGDPMALEESDSFRGRSGEKLRCSKDSLQRGVQWMKPSLGFGWLMSKDSPIPGTRLVEASLTRTGGFAWVFPSIFLQAGICLVVLVTQWFFASSLVFVATVGIWGVLDMVVFLVRSLLRLQANGSGNESGWRWRGHKHPRRTWVQTILVFALNLEGAMTIIDLTWKFKEVYRTGDFLDMLILSKEEDEAFVWVVSAHSVALLLITMWALKGETSEGSGHQTRQHSRRIGGRAGRTRSRRADSRTGEGCSGRTTRREVNQRGEGKEEDATQAPPMISHLSPTGVALDMSWRLPAPRSEAEWERLSGLSLEAVWSDSSRWTELVYLGHEELPTVPAPAGCAGGGGSGWLSSTLRVGRAGNAGGVKWFCSRRGGSREGGGGGGVEEPVTVAVTVSVSLVPLPAGTECRFRTRAYMSARSLPPTARGGMGRDEGRRRGQSLGVSPPTGPVVVPPLWRPGESIFPCPPLQHQ